MVAPNGNGDKISRGSLTAIISAAGLVFAILAGFAGYALTTLGGRIDKIDASVSESQHDRLSIREHDEFKLRIDAAAHDIKDEILRIRESIVPRGEVAERMNAIIARIDNNQRQLDDVRKSFDGIFPPVRSLDEISKRIQRLEDERIRAVRP